MCESAMTLFADPADCGSAIVDAAGGLRSGRAHDLSWVSIRFVDDDLYRSSPFCAGIPIPQALARAGSRRLTEFVAGRACAREAVRRLTAKAMAPGMGSDRAPVWPEGIVGSISHCGDRAIAVVGAADRYLGLGIDLERPLSASEADEIAPLVLTDAERQRLGTRLDEKVVSLVFSAKESLFKALSRLTGPIPFFAAFELVTLGKGTARFRLLQTQSPRWHSNRVFAVRLDEFDGLFATFAAINPDLTSTEDGRPSENGSQRSSLGDWQGVLHRYGWFGNSEQLG